MKLRVNQERAVDFIYEHDKSLILAPVGAGKTAIAQTAIKEMLADGIVKRFLVLAPKRVCTDVWAQEAVKWMPDVSIIVAVGGESNRVAAFKSLARVVVLNYDNLTWLCADNAALLEGFDGVVFDELTRLKDPSGKRFKSLDKCVDQFAVRIGLTGSFTSNGLEDVFGQCKIVDRKILGRSKGAYLQQYFHCLDREKSIYEPREGATELVMQRIKPSVYMIDNQIYKDTLPPLHIVPIDCVLVDRKPYEKMKKDLAYAFPDANIIAANAAVVTGKLQQMAGGFVYETTKTPSETRPGKFDVTQRPVWFSSHKFDRLDELLTENQNAPTLLVYNFKEELAELRRRFKVATLDDDSSVVERWNAGKIPLLAVHPKSAGHGLNLQFGGSMVVFISMPWSQELFEQVIGRLHRSGQTKAVWCYLLLTEKSIDFRVLDVVNGKADLSNIAIAELK